MDDRGGRPTQAFDNVTSMLERMQARQIEEAKAAGFDSLDAWEQHKADEAHAAWESLEPEALLEARRETLRRCGTLISAGDQARVAEGRLRMERARVMAAKWLAGDKPILVLCGPVGTGKSVAAAWAIVELAKPQMRSTWEWTVSELGNGGTSKPGTTTAHEFVRRAVRGHGHVVHAPRVPQTFDPWRGETEDDRPLLRWAHPFLVIDDLGTEQLTARWSEAFGHLIDERLARGGCRTIITTNLPKSKVRERYGDRIADRWNAHAVAVELKGESMRGKGQGL